MIAIPLNISIVTSDKPLIFQHSMKLLKCFKYLYLVFYFYIKS